QLGIGTPALVVEEPTRVELPREAAAGVVANSENHTVAFLKRGVPGPVPRLIVTPGRRSLTASWNSTPARLMKYHVKLFNPVTKVQDKEFPIEEMHGRCPATEIISPNCEHTFIEPHETNVLEKAEPQQVVVSACEFETVHFESPCDDG